MIVDGLLMDAQNLSERFRMTGAWFQTKVLSTHYMIYINHINHIYDLMQLLKDSYTVLHGQNGTAIRLLALASRLSNCTNRKLLTFLL